MCTKLVICIPTYNRAEVVDDVLNKELPMLNKHQVDIILYDSSEGEETEAVYKKYREQGFHNLFYRRIDKEVPSNQKVYMLYQDMEKSEYDYVWMIHDSEAIAEKALLFIMQQLSQEKCFYVLNCRKKAQFKCTEMVDREQFFREGALLLTLYGASIISVKKFIVGTDWKVLEKKYIYSESINFSHVGFYFERAARVEQFECSLIELEQDSLVFSAKHTGSGWRGEAIRIWTESWASTILKLPKIYTNKKDVIRSNERIHLTRKLFLEYRRQGTFNIKVLLRYWKWLGIASSENRLHYLLIAIINPEWMLMFYQHRFLQRVRREQKKGKKIVIYGAGKYALECARIFEKNGIDFDKFIVTNAQKNAMELESHAVVEARKYLMEEEMVLVVIAVAFLSAQGIAEYLENELKVKNWMLYEI